MAVASDYAQSKVRLTKADLLCRLDARSRERYGEPFSAGLMNDLIEAGF
jgi:hypothetical protein